MADAKLNSGVEISGILAEAIGYHRIGQLKEARAAYDKVLADNSKDHQVLHLLGLLSQQEGNIAKAAELYQIAIRLDSLNQYYHNDLGTVLEDLGHLDKALIAYQKALNIKSDFPQAANNIGNVFNKLGRFEDALAWYRKTLTIQSDYTEAYVNIGGIMHDRGRLAEAIQWYQQAMKLNPDLAAGHHHLGLVYKDQGRLNEAIECYQKALSLTPAPAKVLNSLGIALCTQGRLEEGVSCYREAIQHQPVFPEAYTNLGSALKGLGKPDEALVCFQKALTVKPDAGEIYNNMGSVWRDKGDLEQAVSCYRQAIILREDLVEAYFNLGSVNKEWGKLKNSIEFFRSAVVRQPTYSKALNQLVHQIQRGCLWKELDDFAFKLDSLTAQELKQGVKTGETPFVSVSRRADPEVNLAIASSFSRHISKAAASLKKNYNFKGAVANQSRIRIGYLSSDFRDHATAHLMMGLFGCHSRNKFEVFCYSHGRNDGSTYRKRIQNDCDKFIELIDRSDGDAADQIHEDKIDILVDLKGHTRDHRLAISALRPAPVQVSFLGFPGTTGADFFDYIIADPTVIPERHKSFYSEKIVYMPHCYQVNDHTQAIVSDRSPAAAHGLPEDGFVFSAFHQSYKIDPIMFNSWMNILTAVPGSVLWLLKNNDFAEQNLKMAAKKRGIDPHRLVFGPRMPKEKHLGRHRLAELMLDSRIYNGHTTTSDALWAGVPVISLMGSHFASRVSASLLKALGLPELITDTLEEYEKLSVRLALDSAELKMLQKKLAKNQKTHPLFDTRRYVRNLENAFIQMWHTYAAGLDPNHIEVRED
jgi:protein O-GlcNAc transferase